jgi:glycosyltransferase involved in cell wall biosynthesis
MTTYIVDIEAVDSRYTKQWKEHLPKQMANYIGQDVVVVSGGEVPQATTPGAFLNFAGTNNYKSQQMLEISRMFANGEIKDGDYFLYTDAWNPTVIQLRYMAELLGINIQCGGMWHAGSYDPADFLGRLIGAKPWVRHAEASMFECYDHNFFATQFHIDMFCKAFGCEPNEKFIKVGWPMEYLKKVLKPFKDADKENIILFPHRIAPEKQPDMFRELAESMPQYKFVFAQETELTKKQYHELLAKSKLVFSANLQETLGISWYEGALVGTLPMVPNRLSYSEMATDEVLYPSEWTDTYENFVLNKEKVIDFIEKQMTRNDYKQVCQKLVKKTSSFFDGKKLYKQTSSS